MGLIKHRPKISLLLQREIRPGGTYEAVVVIEARREVPIEYLKVQITGEERGVIGSGNQRRTVRHPVLTLAANLSGKRKLSKGREEFPFTFTLPPEIPRSYAGQVCSVTYSARVLASIPWWLDAKVDFEIFVSSLPDLVTEEESLLFSSDPSGPRAREPHVEGSLASSLLRPGGLVEGAVALTNVDFNPYSAIVVGIVGVEKITLKGGKSSTYEAHRYIIEIPLHEPREGESIPFKFRLPKNVPPSYDGSLGSLSWSFITHAKIKWRTDLLFYMPIMVISDSGGLKEPKRAYRAPPSVGSGRIEKIWKGVAEELGLSYAPGLITGEIGDVSFEMIREHRGREGVFLVGRLSFSDLHLDLELEPHTSLIKRIFLEGDRGTWDSNYSLIGRDQQQAVHIAAPFRQLLDDIHRIHISDDTASLEIRGAGQKVAKLRWFAETVRHSAEILDERRRSIPPPLCMKDELSLWEKLAKSLDGELETARMVVRGRFHGMDGEVRTEWLSDGQPDRTLVILSHGLALSKDKRLHLTRQPTNKEPEAWLYQSSHYKSLIPDLESFWKGEGREKELLRAIVQKARAFEMTAEQARLSLEAPLDDPLQSLGRLSLMAQLCELHRGGKGPFR